MKYLKEIEDHYNKRFPGEDFAPIGASEEEVGELEKRLGFKLPGAHREFLLWMGKDHKGVFRGTAWFLKDIEMITEILPDWLAYNNLPPPEGKYVSCYNHQGYAVGWYLVPSEEEDPDMYFFMETDDKRKRPFIWGSFSEWVLHCMESCSLDPWDQREARQKHLKALEAAKATAANEAPPPA